MATNTYREQMLERAGDAFSVAGRQRYEALAERGYPYSRSELQEKIGNAFSVSERQFYEGLWDEQFGRNSDINNGCPASSTTRKQNIRKGGRSMSKHLKELVQKYQKELRYRDGGAAAKATYAQIKKIATAEELVKILEKTRNR